MFLRAPRLGTVKTRLAATLGAETALTAYRHLVARTLDAIKSFDDVELRFTPDDASAEILPWKREPWRAEPQGEGSLGERLDRALTAAFASGSKRMVVVGTDCPGLAASDIEDAFVALNSVDLVLGPATDGGYWLIGTRRSCSALFKNISWGSSEVLAQTLCRAREADLAFGCLRELSDVDTASDWEKYRRQGEVFR